MFGTPLALESPLACNRHAFSAEERKRHFDVLIPALRSRIKSVEESVDGYQFEFHSDEATFELVAHWADGERLCCPFFEIELDHEAGAVWLRLKGPDGAKKFIRAELSHFFEAE
jgi:hypothetical protein